MPEVCRATSHFRAHLRPYLRRGKRIPPVPDPLYSFKVSRPNAGRSVVGGRGGMQSISRGGLKGIPGSGEGVRTLHPVAGEFTNRQLQDAVDALHAVLGSPSVRARKVTIVSVISNNNSVPSIAQQKLAREIFGDSVVFVRGTTRTNAPSEKGNHAERRGMQAIENPAGTVQASSHYACGSCEGAQAGAGVRSATGAASQNGGKVTRPINPPETPSRLHQRPRKKTSE